MKKLMGAMALSMILSALFLSIYRPTLVHQESMEPTFQDGSRLLMNVLSYKTKEPKRNDIVVFQDNIHSNLLIKRVIAIPGDHLTIDSNGEVIINGQVVNEFYLREKPDAGDPQIDTVIPSDAVWVMGDNRNHSYDSRHELGYIGYKNILGKVIHKFK